MKKRINFSTFLRFLIILFAFTFLGLLIYEIINQGELIVEIVLLILLEILFIINIFYLKEGYEQKIKNIKSFYKNIPESAKEFERRINGGYLLYDKTGKIIFISHFLSVNNFKKFIGESIDLFHFPKNSKTKIFIFEEQFFLIYRFNKKRLLIFKSLEEERAYQQMLDDRILSVIIIKKHFSNKTQLNEFNRLKINLNINNYLKKWSTKMDAILRTESNLEENILILGYWKNFNKEIENEFLLKKLIEIIGNNLANVSLSIGASYGNLSFQDLLKNANQALETSKNRGGNQIILFDEKRALTVIGKSSLQIQDNSKIEISMFYNKLLYKIQKYDHIMIFSHIKADIDSLASSLALVKFLSEYNLDFNILVDDFDESGEKVFRNLSPKLKELFIGEKEAKTKINNKTLAIILDISTINHVQHFEILEKFPDNQRILIDHHRIGENKIDVLTENIYIDVSASSVSEIIAEFFLLKKNSDYEHLTVEEASLLILGIYLDTNNLKRNTSARTYEALTFLSNEGGEVENIIDYMKSDFLDTPLIIETLENAQRLKTNIIFSFLSENTVIGSSTLSYLANMLLDYEGIDASFMIGRVSEKNFKISARSNGKINVQLIMEKLGGGGHYNIAAANFEKGAIRYKNLRKKIRDIILTNTEQKNKKKYGK